MFLINWTSNAQYPLLEKIKGKEKLPTKQNHDPVMKKKVDLISSSATGSTSFPLHWQFHDLGLLLKCLVLEGKPEFEECSSYIVHSQINFSHLDAASGHIFHAFFCDMKPQWR